MTKTQAKQPIVCVENDGYVVSLEKRKIYVALPASGARPGTTTSPRQRPRIAHAPAAGLNQCDEAFDHFVEQRRLFQIEHVA